MSNDETVEVFTSDRPRAPVTLTRRELDDSAARFARELCEHVAELQETGNFTPERVAQFVRGHRLAARALMTEGR